MLRNVYNINILNVHDIKMRVTFLLMYISLYTYHWTNIITTSNFAVTDVEWNHWVIEQNSNAFLIF